jgi:predicted amidohydrolase
VFETDFGKIGIQICYDIEYPETWQRLSAKGAEIVFWPSAFAAGKKVNTKAWEGQYYMVSSTRKGASKIVDLIGEDIAASGLWSSWGICAEINLEKAFLHSYPSSYKFPAIQKKYGKKVHCYSLHEEEFSIIESLSPDLKVADILKEFDLVTYQEQLRQAAEGQQKLRT